MCVPLYIRTGSSRRSCKSVDYFVTDESYPRKVDVNALNSARLAAIELPTIRYEASDVPGLDQFGKKLSLKEATKLLNEDTRWPAVVDLKVGAMVMLVTVSLASFSSETTDIRIWG